MITTAWDQIDAATLQALCDAGDEESPTLDFKREAPKKQMDDPDNEFAKDVCGFANANGGDLVYGIADDKGVAKCLMPLTGEPFDACRRRLTQVIDNHVEPRISGIRFRKVPVDENSYAMVVRVPSSFDGPHRFHVRRREGGPAHYRFVKRTQSLTDDMDYLQLRDAFGHTATLLEKARAWRVERLALMERGLLMRGLVAGPKLCVHLVPLAGFAHGAAIDIAEVYHRSDINFNGPGGFCPQKQTNLDGLLLMGPGSPPLGRADRLARLFRNGSMECLGKAFSVGDPREQAEPFIPAVAVTAEIRRVCAQLLEHARALGFVGPAIVGLAGIECGRHCFRIVNDNSHFPYGNGLADQEQLVLPEQIVESVATDVDVDVVVRPLLDAFWQCFGEVRCDRYDETGKWRPPA